MADNTAKTLQQYPPQFGDKKRTFVVSCQGGLNATQDTLGYKPGEATQLVNFEPSNKAGGYRRINGYSKFDTNAVTGSGKILGVAVYNGATAGVVACRSTHVYFSAGSGWTQIDTTARTGALKYRFCVYDFSGGKRIAMCDQVNFAAKWDGTTYTRLNGANAPDTPKFATFWLKRLVLAGYANGAGAQGVMISSPDTDDDFVVANGSIELNNRDEVVGIRSFREQLFIFGKRTINRLTGTSATNFSIVPVATNIGCVASDSIQEVDGKLIFLAPDGFRMVQETERLNDYELGTISKPVFAIAPGIVAAAGAADNISSALIRAKNQYRLFYPTTSGTISDSLGILFGLRQNSSLEDINLPQISGEWAQLQGIKPSCCDSGFNGTQEIIVHGDWTDGFVYKQENGFSFNGSNIPATYTSAPMVLEDPELRKTIHNITAWMNVEGTCSINVQAIYDLNDTNTSLQPPAVTVVAGGSLYTYGGATSLYGTAVYGGGSQNPRLKTNQLGSGFIVQVQFTSNDMSAPYSIQSFSIQYILSGRR